MFPNYKTSPEGFPAAQVSPSIIYCLETREGCEGYFLVSHSSLTEITFLDLPAAHKFTIGKVDSIDAFRSYASEMANHYGVLEALDRKSYATTTSTPWGRAQTATKYGPGITSYDTPGHGGFKVSDGRNKLIPTPYRNDNGWYEEDSEWAKVAATFPEHFTSFEIKEARKTLINSLPDEYEAVTGEEILPGQSYVRDKQIFKRENAENWVVISALSSDEHEGMVECIATMGGKRSGYYNGVEVTVEEREFLVPDAEYGERSRFGFVIDEARHESVSTSAGLSM
ncbi:hypothetical protein [Roseibium sp. RKSG952]|uniref:DUF7007 domain-containing protein n=1 Tax=Roseibium sp. RKSG952 TaxID=2529384 RepID=UPI0012BD22A1|nr:hypothetical protein [Roseibium sp. RKSG952]MTH94730.1 hypothetical protein [Roseibium sp. RKSG952]